MILLAVQLDLFGPSITTGMADVYYSSQHLLCLSMLAPLLLQSDTKVQTCSWFPGNKLFTASSFCLHYRNYSYWAVLRCSSDYTGSWYLPQDLVVLQNIWKAKGQVWKGWKRLKMGEILTSLLEIFIHSLAPSVFMPYLLIFPSDRSTTKGSQIKMTHTHFGEM